MPTHCIRCGWPLDYTEQLHSCITKEQSENIKNNLCKIRSTKMEEKLITKYHCVVCKEPLEEREEGFRLSGAGPIIYGPGERDNWGKKLSEPFCPKCGIKYDRATLTKKEEENK